MLVDDEPANLTLLEELLQLKDTPQYQRYLAMKRSPLPAHFDQI